MQTGKSGQGRVAGQQGARVTTSREARRQQGEAMRGNPRRELLPGGQWPPFFMRVRHDGSAVTASYSDGCNGPTLQARNTPALAVEHPADRSGPGTGRARPEAAATPTTALLACVVAGRSSACRPARRWKQRLGYGSVRTAVREDGRGESIRLPIVRGRFRGFRSALQVLELVRHSVPFLRIG